MAYKLYDFECPRCGYTFEDLVSDKEEEQHRVKCPRCRLEGVPRKHVQTSYAKHSSWSDW